MEYEPTPEEWQEYLQNALAALRANPGDAEALQAIKDANEVLNAFEQPAIAAGENVGSTGFGHPGAVIEGLGQAALDIPRGIGRFAKNVLTLNPGQAVTDVAQSISSLPGELASGDPERMARATGNIASFGLPGVKVSGRSLAGWTGRAITKPFRAVGAALSLPEARLAESLARQRLLSGREARSAAAARQSEALARQRLSESPTRARGIAEANLEGRTLQNELLRRKLMEEALPDPTSPPETTALRAGETARPIANTGDMGFEILGERATPPVPTQPTLLEMQGGLTARKMRGQGVESGQPQKGVIFGEETTYSPDIQAQFKVLLGELARSLAGRPRR